MRARAQVQAQSVLVKIPVPTRLALPAPVVDPLMLELIALKAKLAQRLVCIPR